ncbi:MAG: RluA family pseudouridine synthase [Chloroflexi bacterium]|nr:RluA family pseudouridine synthase [Chloroflexota bacterium]
MAGNDVAETVRVVYPGDGQRVDAYLASLREDWSRAQVQRLIRSGRVLVNDATVRASNRLETGDVIVVELPDVELSGLAAQVLPLHVLYEDAHVIVLDKPAGLPVHPGAGHADGTLVNALIARYPEMAGVGGQRRPGIVHRLDADTSGVMVAARSPLAYLDLVRQMSQRQAEKVYLALVRGYPQPPTGVIDAPIGRHPTDRKRMALSSRGRQALTEYRTLGRYKGYALLEVRIHTGRTHQIRVHCSAMGHPVAGDVTYGGRAPFLQRQFLHAHRLAFTHPVGGERLEFTSELPEDLRQALDGLQGE